MAEPFKEVRSAILLEENLKKALTEFLLLHLLSEKECYIGELTSEIERRSDGIIHIEFPYYGISRVYKAGYIIECGKRTAPDGRMRQYYRITEEGLTYLKELQQTYNRMIGGVTKILQKRGDKQ